MDKKTLENKIIAFPTDTVFGVGALIDDPIAINKIYQLKKRDFNKPLAILAATFDDIKPFVTNVDTDIMNIIKANWPGALTIIFKKSEFAKNILDQNLDTLAFRIPNCQEALELLSKTGPLATTSVNISGESPINTYQQIKQLFGNQIDYIIEKNVKSSNVSSTIIDVSTGKIKIIRQGEIKIV